MSEIIEGKTIAVWFSNGAASAEAAKETIYKYGRNNNILIVNNPVIEEHEDNRRFLKDMQEYLQHPIIEAKNKDFPNASIVEVFNKRKYMSGIKGAPCTSVLKKEARYQFELSHNIDYHVLGFTVDEWKRQKDFNEKERANTIPVLCSSLTTKEDCFKSLKKAGIKIPEVYLMGLPNANCLGCVKSSSPTYWNMIRVLFPDVFLQRATQSRTIGCRLVRYKGKRIFLDELPANAVGGKIKSWECGIFCDTY